MTKTYFKFICLFFITAVIFIYAANLSLDLFTPTISVAHAQTPTPTPPPPGYGTLHGDLQPSSTTQHWIFTEDGRPGVWNLCLGLANVFAALVILFFAVVNIAHIQYDTYQLKKSLPYLILGVVLANFSMFISRMIVDFAQVLANTFINQGGGDFGRDLMCSFMFRRNTGDAISDLSVNIMLNREIGLPLIIIISLLILIVVLIVSFLLWIRLMIILILAAVSPLAFVMMAFGLTQGLFKQWLGWFLRWTFMGPVAVMMLWLASIVGRSNCHSWNMLALFMSLGLMIAAIWVPFALGGKIMNAWGGLGKKAAIAGYNNPWSKAKRAETKKNLSSLWGNSWLGKKVDEAKQAEAWHTGDAEQDVATRAADATDRWRRGKGKISNEGDRVRRQLDLKRRQEQIADLDFKSREGLGLGIHTTAVNGDQGLQNVILEAAAEEAMVTDVMQELKKNVGDIARDENDSLKPSDQQKKLLNQYNLPVDFDFEDGSERNQWKFLDHMTHGDLKAQSRIQEAGVRGGMANYKIIVTDPTTKSGYRRLDIGDGENLGDPEEPGISAEEAKNRKRRREDLDLYEKMTIRRFQSPDAHKGIRSIRKEVFFDKDKKITGIGMFLLENGIFTEEHVNLANRARTSLNDGFDQPGNLDSIEARAGALEATPTEKGLAKAKHLRRWATRLRDLGYGTGAGVDQVVIRDPAGHPININIADIENTPEDETAIESQIVRRVTQQYQPGEKITINGQPTDAITYINQQIQNSHLSNRLKIHISGLSALKNAQAEINSLNSGKLTADAEQEVVERVTNTIRTEVANALQNGIEISPIVQGIINMTPKGPGREEIRKQFREAIASSPTPVLNINGVNLSASSIIQSYEQAKTPDRPGQKLNEIDVQLRFQEMIRGIGLPAGAPPHKMTQLEKDRAWRLVKTYEGKVDEEKRGRANAQRNVLRNYAQAAGIPLSEQDDLLNEVEMEEGR